VTAFIHVLSAIAFVAAIWIAISAARMKRDINRARARLRWIQEEAQRAVQLLESRDRDRIMTGLQTLVALNVPEVRLEALQKIAALAKSADPAVAACASDTLDQVLPAVSAPARSSRKKN
jgi:hypothetical protein